MPAAKSSGKPDDAVVHSEAKTRPNRLLVDRVRQAIRIEIDAIGIDDDLGGIHSARNQSAADLG